jgi:phosphoglycerol transferase MdoB-like AlkP superfamily enzyme
MSQVTHLWLPLNPAWEKLNYQAFTQDKPDTQSTDLYLNGIRETDDLVRDIILGFRKRGLENETLFVMYLALTFR